MGFVIFISSSSTIFISTPFLHHIYFKSSKEPVNNSNEDEFVELDEETSLESDFDTDDISEDLD